MLHSRYNSRVLAIGAVASLAAVLQAGATLISYEGFDYVAGTTLNGATNAAYNGQGGTGWGAYWSSDTAGIATNTSTGLTYGSLQTKGGSAIIGSYPYPSGTGGSTTAQPQRVLPGTLSTLTGGAGTMWVSFLYQNLNSDRGSYVGYRETGIRFMVGGTTNVALNVSGRNGTDRLDAGTPNTYAVGATDTYSLFSAPTFASTGISTLRGTDAANTAFFLIQLSYDATTANDTAYLWINPSLASAPDVSTANATYTTADLTSINAIRLQAGNKNSSGTNAAFIIDELRIGTAFGDVAPVPEPASLALLGVSGLCGWMLFRRKQQ